MGRASAPPAAPPLACVPRGGLIWLQGISTCWASYRWPCGLWGFAWRGGYPAQLCAILFGIAAIENYNATWGAIGAALGAWAWVRREGWSPSRPRAVRP